jgi:hypothetical protein
MSTPYDVQADSVVQALIAEAVADPDVIGLVLTFRQGMRTSSGQTRCYRHLRCSAVE